MRVILTHHAKRRISKRLLKKKNPTIGELYNEIREFLKNTKSIEIPHGRGKNVIFTDGSYTLVCAYIKSVNKFAKEKILENITSFPFNRLEAHILDDVGLYSKKKIIDRVKEIPMGEYWFFMNVEKGVVYIGKEEPLLGITFRPAKRWERGTPIVWAMSIYKKYADMIFTGEKKWELRKSVPRDLKPGDIVYIYVPRPVGAYVGSFRVGSIIKDNPENLWERVGSETGLTKEEFMNYFLGYKLGIAIEVREPELFERRLELEIIRKYLPEGVSHYITPQNIMRLRDNLAHLIGLLSSSRIMWLEDVVER